MSESIKSESLEQRGPAPFNTGDVVKLKSGGFPMTVVECGWVGTGCSDAAGYWEASVVYAPDNVPAKGKGLIYEDVCTDLLMSGELIICHGISRADLPF